MANLSSLDKAFVAIILCIYVFNQIQQRRRRKGAKPPPGPRGLPIIGNALELAKDPHLLPTFNRWDKRYGPVVGINVFGQKMVVISSERIANELFAKRGNIYSDRGTPPALAVVSGAVQPALIDKTDTWRRQRKLMHSLLSITENARYEPFMDIESSYTLLDLLETSERFDDHLARYAYGVVSRSALGIKTKSISDPFVKEIQHISEFAVNCFRPDKYLSNLAPWVLKLPSWINSEFAVLDGFRRRMHRNWLARQDVLRSQIEKDEAPSCLQVDFLKHQHEHNVTDLEGAAVFGAFMGAGTRSPHNALLGFVIVMLQYPDWLRKLQTELDEVVGSSRLPNFQDMPRLPTVRAVVKESIRYRSVCAEIGIPHKLSQDDEYEGYFFEKGTIFHINTSAMSVDPDLYPDGFNFNPARWLDPAYPTYKEPLTIHPNLQHFTSFGFGRRACPGFNFTERSITIMVARFAWACNIKRAVDPATKKQVELNIVYEPVANPRPLPFPAAIEPRSKERTELVKLAVQAAIDSDPLP